MKTVIRPNIAKIFLSQRQLWILLFVVLLIAIFTEIPRIWAMFWVFLIFLTIISVLALPLYLRSFIEITDQYLTGWIPRQTFHIPFSDIRIANEVQSQNRKYFFIHTEKVSLYLPLDFFNSDELKRHLREKISPLAFEDQAYIDFQNSTKKRLLGDTILAGANMLSTWPLWIGVVLGLVFLGLRIWVSKSNDLFYLSGCLSIPSLILIFICYARIKADAISIKVLTRSGRFEFLWEDLETVQISQTGNTVVLRGKNKQLIVDLSLAGKNRGDLIRKILVHMEDKKITPVNKPIYFPIFNKNTRLTKDESF